MASACLTGLRHVSKGGILILATQSCMNCFIFERLGVGDGSRGNDCVFCRGVSSSRLLISES